MSKVGSVGCEGSGRGLREHISRRGSGKRSWAQKRYCFSLFRGPPGSSLPGQRHLSVQPNGQHPDGPKTLCFLFLLSPRGGSLSGQRHLSLQPIRLRGYPRPTSGNLLSGPDWSSRAPQSRGAKPPDPPGNVCHGLTKELFDV